MTQSTEIEWKRKTSAITPFQIFTLSYLYSQELFLENRDTALDKVRLATHHLQSRITKNPISMNVKQISHHLTSKCCRWRSNRQWNGQTTIAFRRERVTWSRYARSSSEGFGSFSITTEGILLVKKIFGNIKESIKDKKLYEQRIERTEGDSETKKWLIIGLA